MREDYFGNYQKTFVVHLEENELHLLHVTFPDLEENSGNLSIEEIYGHHEGESWNEEISKKCIGCVYFKAQSASPLKPTNNSLKWTNV